MLQANSRTEYFDGEYRWPTMHGTYDVPMLLLNPVKHAARCVLFWDHVKEDYEERFVCPDEVILGTAPASLHGALWQGAGVAA